MVVPVETLVKKSEYHDSVTLMQVAKSLTAMPGVQDAAVVMGTEANRGILAEAGLLTPEAEAATPNDLVIVVKAESDEAARSALAQVEPLLTQKRGGAGGAAYRPHSIDTAVRTDPESNLAVISVAGRYAATETRRALEQGLHVFLFSDNVPLEDEIALKRYAESEGLFLMGPDAGTAIINGVALGFANAVPAGPIGLVAASGTGLQEVTTLIARRGSGITQAVGVGGRDLSEAVGGIMMRMGLEALQDDPDTEVIVLVSKPPAPSVAGRVLGLVGQSDKPTVVCFLGGDAEAIEQAGGIPAATLEEAALLAVRLARGKKPKRGKLRRKQEAELGRLAKRALKKLKARQKYVRGLFCGGTFCYEAMLVMQETLGTIHSNTPLEGAPRLEDPNRSVAHTCVDLGEDEFTVGRLHPMLDLSLRNRRIEWEASDPEVAVVLLDVVLGYGVHPDPAGETAAAIVKARQSQKSPPVFVAHVCGTDADPQNRRTQVAKLRAAGVLVAESNAAAARLAAMIAG